MGEASTTATSPERGSLTCGGRPNGSRRSSRGRPSGRTSPAYPDFTVHTLAAHIDWGLRLFHAIVIAAATSR
jgi:hypothetical protein